MMHNHTYTQQVDWNYHHTCEAENCQGLIKSGTGHTTVYHVEGGREVHGRDIPLSHYHDRCAPGRIVDLDTPMHPNGMEPSP